MIRYHQARDPADADQNPAGRVPVAPCQYSELANGSMPILGSTSTMPRSGNDPAYLLRDWGRPGQSLQFHRAGDIRICRIASVVDMHNYSPAARVIELRLDLPGKYVTATMIVSSSDQIVTKTVHDHEKDTRALDCIIMHSRSAFECPLMPLRERYAVRDRLRDAVRG